MEIKEAKQTSGTVEIVHEFDWKLEKSIHTGVYELSFGNICISVFDEEAEQIMAGNKNVLLRIIDRAFNARLKNIKTFLELL